MSTSEFCFGQVDAGVNCLFISQSNIYYIVTSLFLNEVAFLPGSNKSNRNSKLRCWTCLFNRLASLCRHKVHYGPCMVVSSRFSCVNTSCNKIYLFLSSRLIASSHFWSLPINCMSHLYSTSRYYRVSLLVMSLSRA